MVVGCPSLDRLHRHGRSREAVGGAAFITALGARAAGARVGLLALLPDKLPAEVARALAAAELPEEGLLRGRGPLPSHHVVYEGGDRAVYVEIAPGVESELRAADLPESWLGARGVHVASLGGDPEVQLRFVRELRERGYRGWLSAGTFGRAVQEAPERVRELAGQADFFFCNAEEAERLGPLPERAGHRPLQCVTLGADGVELRGARVERRPAPEVAVVDPTGAGDAFCGAFLGGLLRGEDPVEAGLRAAARVLSGPGAEPLLGVAPEPVGVELDHPLVALDPARIRAVAALLASSAGAAAFSFTGDPFPDADEPGALTALAVATMHQYGFWTADEAGWTGSMFAELDGRRRKGSDFVWRAFTRALRDDPGCLSAERMAAEEDAIDRICRDDGGRCPLPALASHRALHRRCGEALLAAGHRDLGEHLVPALRAPRPLSALLARLGELPGFAEDPLRKKAALLAAVLAARPEGFLRPAEGERIPPIVDYHLMRGALRSGCVAVRDDGLRERLTARAWVDPGQEAALRQATHAAIEALVRASGRGVPDVDAFFFSTGRSRCLEDEAPRCDDGCALEPACARRVGLFQPVFRTTAY